MNQQNLKRREPVEQLKARQTGEFFTSSGKTPRDTNLNGSVRTIMDTIPLQQAGSVAVFAIRLGRLGRGAQKNSAQTR
jgi:hypothetical protein